MRMKVSGADLLFSTEISGDTSLLTLPPDQCSSLDPDVHVQEGGYEDPSWYRTGKTNFSSRYLCQLVLYLAIGGYQSPTGFRLLLKSRDAAYQNRWKLSKG